MGIKSRIKTLLNGPTLKAPFSCRHLEHSIIASLDDDPAKPSDRLLNISLEAIRYAHSIDLSDVSARMKEPPYWPDVWPGEHYKLLAGLMLAVKPKLVLEIGTFTGLSALSMLKTLPSSSKIVTFDILKWKAIPDTHLNEEDFKDGRLRQCLGDLANKKVFLENKDLLELTDIIFIDGPKNISFEEAFLENFAQLRFNNSPLLIFDDIRVWNMLRIWREIRKPKLDITSFGHWSGTGLVDWC